MTTVDALLLTSHDPWREPTGGQRAFARLLLKSYGSRLAVASMCEEPLPVRRWSERQFERDSVRFFNIGPYPGTNEGSKPLIPVRLTCYMQAVRSMAGIRKLGVRNLLVDSPELIMAAAGHEWDSICYRFAGLSNAVEHSRYAWAQLFHRAFQSKLVSALRRVNPDVFLACADQEAIDAFLERIDHRLPRGKFVQFPTRVDTEIFHPKDRTRARAKCKLPLSDTILVATGRVARGKGWELLVDSLKLLENKKPRVRLVFVGDGEDHEKLLKHAQSLGIADSITITGFVPQTVVSRYINAGDLCVVGSYREGWSLAMCESLACGKPLVSTPVSGASEMICEGVNGFIVSERSPAAFAQAIDDALKLEGAAEESLRIANRYSVSRLARELGMVWKVLET